MAPLVLSLACTVSDRTRPLMDGRVTVPGCAITFLPGEPEDIFRRALRDRAFDVTELSMGSHIVTTARGDSPYIGVPVFPSRAFRHSAIYVRADRGLASPADLRGRRIGVPEYQQTAAMWVRGMMLDQHGVRSSEVSWRTGGLNEPGTGERIALKLPEGLDVKPVDAGESLNGLLAAGEIDAVISPRPPSCFVEASAPVARLFADTRAAETAYYRATGFFPIMHCLAVRRELAAEHPWLPLDLFRAFVRAKALSLGELGLGNVLRISLPWITSQYREACELMGGNPWPYGFRRNADEIAAMIRYATADGLAVRAMDAAELFHPSTLDAADSLPQA
jgi:4,5-dihydroxyphthalate decarboxylase